MSTFPPVTPGPLRHVAPHRGTLILVFGILSLVVCAILGVFAWVMGNNDLKQMDAGLMDPSGRGITQAGKICGIIGTIFMIIGLVVGLLYLVIVILVVVLGLAGAASGAGGGTGP